MKKYKITLEETDIENNVLNTSTATVDEEVIRSTAYYHNIDAMQLIFKQLLEQINYIPKI
jgi:hypothetical protein